MIASVLLAAGLSSSAIGTFFDLPEWAPTSVGFKDTPGSDLSDGTGWYEEEYVTNGYTQWSATMNGEPSVSMTLSLGTAEPHRWTVTGISPAPQDFYSVTGWETVTLGDDDSTYLSWKMDVWGCAELGSPALSTNTYECSAIRSVQYLQTGKMVPRPARLTKGVYSGLNSTFEAYFERAYFAGCGETNAWDESVWGPTDIRHFDFSKDGGGFNYVPTNRVLTTARLANQWPNLVSVLSALRGDASGRWRFHASRPSWHTGYDTFWWSSRHGEFATCGIFPTDWERHLFNIGWGSAVAPLGSLGGTTYWPCAANKKEMVAEVLQGVLAEVWLGDPDDDPMKLTLTQDEYLYMPKIRPAGVYTNLEIFVISNFPNSNPTPYADGNIPLRLRSEVPCVENQVLSLLDRSYRRVNVTAQYGYVDVYRYTNSRTAQGTYTFNVTTSFGNGDALEGSFCKGGGGCVDVSFPLIQEGTWTFSENQMTTNVTRTAALNDAMIAYFDGRESEVTSDDAVGKALFYITKNEVLNAAAQAFLDITNGTLIFKSANNVVIRDGRPTIDIDIVTTNGDYVMGSHIGVAYSNSFDVTVGCGVTVRRGYRYRETDLASSTFTSDDFSESRTRGFGSSGKLKYPGRDAYSTGRVESSKLLAVSSIGNSINGSQIGAAQEVTYSDHGSGLFANLYSAETYDASVGVITSNEPARVMAKIKEDMADSVGANPKTQPNHVIGIYDRAMLDISGSLYFTNGTYQVKAENDFSFPVDFEDGRAVEVGEGEGFTTLPIRAVSVEIRLNKCRMSSVYGTNDQHRTYSSGSSSYLQEIDWNWKTLNIDSSSIINQ